MLNLDGGNWPIFRNKFEDLIEGLGIETHFDLTNYPASEYSEIEEEPEQKSGESESDFKKRLEVWKEGEKKWKEEVRT